MHGGVREGAFKLGLSLYFIVIIFATVINVLLFIVLLWIFSFKLFFNAFNFVKREAKRKFKEISRFKENLEMHFYYIE